MFFNYLKQLTQNKKDLYKLTIYIICYKINLKIKIIQFLYKC